MELPKQEKRTSPRFSSRFIERIGAIALIAVLVIALCISICMNGNMQRQYAAARNRMGDAVYQNLYMLVRKNEETALAGADVQGAVLPSMREYFLAAKALNETLGDAYGARYSVLTAEQILTLEHAFADYDAAFKGGKSTDEVQGALNGALAEIEGLLLSRYDAEGRLLPGA